VKTAATIAQMLVRACGLVLLVLGILFWTGNAESLIDLHRLLGFVLVISLLVLVVLAARSGAPPGLVALALAWAVVVPVLGMTQDRLVTGSAHWLIRVLHLLLGLGAIALAERLARLVKGRRGVAPPATA
jgi:hypothetical protein